MLAPYGSADLITFSYAILVILVFPAYSVSCDIFTLRLVTLFLAMAFAKVLLYFWVSMV